MTVLTASSAARRGAANPSPCVADLGPTLKPRVQDRARTLRNLWRADEGDCLHRRSGGDHPHPGASRAGPRRSARPRTPTPRPAAIRTARLNGGRGRMQGREVSLASASSHSRATRRRDRTRRPSPTHADNFARMARHPQRNGRSALLRRPPEGSIQTPQRPRFPLWWCFPLTGSSFDKKPLASGFMVRSGENF